MSWTTVKQSGISISVLDRCELLAPSTSTTTGASGSASRAPRHERFDPRGQLVERDAEHRRGALDRARVGNDLGEQVGDHAQPRRALFGFLGW